MAKKVSVIIPAYNAEKNISDCLYSILSQSYSNLTVFVINDGSTDSTNEKVSSIAEKDHRVKLITVENGGPATARNIGLEYAKSSSDYIMFSDSDDILLPYAIEKLVSEAEKHCSDIVIAGFVIKNPDGTENSYSEPDIVLTRGAFGKAFSNLYRANLLNQVWAKLFSSDMIFRNNLSFMDYRWGEDRLFIFDCLENSAVISVQHDCIYKYIMHPGQSLISGFYDKKADVCVLADDRVGELCSKFSIQDDGYFRFMFAKSIYSCLTNLFSPSCVLSVKEKKEYIHSIISDENIIRRCQGASGGIAIHLLIKIMASKSVPLNMIAARFVAISGKLFPMIFQKIKHKK